LRASALSPRRLSLSLSLTPPRAHLIVVVAALSVVRRVRRVSRARDDGHRRGRQRRRNAAAHRILHVASVVVVLPLLRGCHVQRRLRSSSSAMLVRLAPRLKKRVPVVVVEGRGRGRLVSRRRCSRGLHLCFFGIMHCGFLELAPLPLPQNSERKERDGLESSSLSLSLSLVFSFGFLLSAFSHLDHCRDDGARVDVGRRVARRGPASVLCRPLFFVASPSSSPAEALFLFIILPAPDAPARALLHNLPAARLGEISGSSLRAVAGGEAAPGVRAMRRKVSVWLAFLLPSLMQSFSVL